MKKLLKPLDTTQSLSEGTYTRIREALVKGAFEPGRNLSEPVLALRFGTSRSPVREALMRLEHEGFLERTPHGRVRVKALDITELQQLYVVRASVEGLTARLATPRLRTLDLEELERILGKEERCIKKGDAAGASSAGQEFHDLITRECGNQPLADVLYALRARLSLYRAVSISLGDFDVERLHEHRRILKAFYTRKSALAEAEMIRHINRSAVDLLNRLRKRAEN